MFAIHAITQIASKTEKLWSAKKHHHNFAFWCGMLCEDLSRRYTLSGDTTPQSFRLVKQAENPAPLAQGSQDSRSVLLAEHREPRRLPPQTTDVAKVQTAGKPAGAGCPHPSRCSAKAPHRATFPKGKAKAALESQTPQREPRRLPPQTTNLALLSKFGVNALPCHRICQGVCRG